MLAAVASPEPLGSLASAAAESTHWHGDKDCAMPDAGGIRRWVPCFVKEPCWFACGDCVHQSHLSACWYK